MIKKKLRSLLPYLTYFYNHLGYRLPLILMISIFVGLLDGLGLAMFIPILELVADPNNVASSENLGNLAFILNSIQQLGFDLTLAVVLTIMLLFFSLKGLMSWFETYLNVVYQQYFIKKIRIENIDALTNFSYLEFVKSDAGEIQNILSGEVLKVMQGYQNYNRMLQQFVLVLVYTFLALLSNTEFALLVFTGGLLSNLAYRSLFKKTAALSFENVQKNSQFQGLLLQKVYSFKYLKATGNINSYANNLREKVEEIENLVRRMGIISALIIGSREPIMIGIVVGVILFQVNILGGGLGTILLSILFFYRALTSIMNLQNVYNRFLSISGSLLNMQNFLSNLREHRDQDTVLFFRAKNISNAIELQNVHFKYDQAQTDYNLKNINLNIPFHQTTAIVGESGSGKTTLMNLICGLFPPTSGEIVIKEKNKKTFNLSEYQRRIGYITQEPSIFDDTFYNNITFWAPKTESNLSLFKEACEKAHIISFVNSLPEKEDTKLGMNGINVSGGQKQRIAIARELFKNVDILLLDEATSALDSETEFKIQENIDALRGELTLIIIAHRLSTVKDADQIVVLKNGQIDAVGSFSDLQKGSATFKHMLKYQEF